MIKNILLTHQDLEEFKEWLKLDIESITWQGRNTKSFDDFWKTLFFGDMQLTHLITSLNFLITSTKTGPMSSWFLWIKRNLIFYTFCKFNPTLLELAKVTGSSIGQTSNLLRDFFTERYPHLDEYWIQVFQNSDASSKNLDLNIEQIKKELHITEFGQGHLEDIMRGLEITLYAEWDKVIYRMKSQLRKKDFDLEKTIRQIFFRKQLNHLKEIVVLTIAGFAIVYILNISGKYFNKGIIQKIEIYKPEELTSNKGLDFKQEPILEDANDKEFEDIQDLEDVSAISKSEDEFTDAFKEEDRFDAESEVVLTSIEKIPSVITNTNAAGAGQAKEGEFRDVVGGDRKVYRLMLKSYDTDSTRLSINDVIKKYGGIQIDSKEPGKYVPGGVYYNLLLPNKNTKEFFEKIKASGEVKLYESRTRGINPPGKIKVFIWIKSL